jgi:hypothetical protein
VTRGWAILFACALGGCGPQSGIWLRVGAPFGVPTQCDELDVSVTRPSDAASIFSSPFTLSAADPFPVTLSLVTDDRADIGQALSVAVQAKLSGQTVGQTSGPVTLESRTLVPLTLTVVAQSPP